MKDACVWHRLLAVMESPCCRLGKDPLTSVLLVVFFAGLVLVLFNQSLCKVLLVHTLVKRVENAVRLGCREHYTFGAGRNTTLLVSAREFLSNWVEWEMSLRPMVHQTGLLELDRSYFFQVGYLLLQDVVVWWHRGLLIAGDLRAFALQENPSGDFTSGQWNLELGRSDGFLPLLSPSKRLNLVHCWWLLYVEKELRWRHNLLTTIRYLNFEGGIMHESLLIMILWANPIGVARNTHKGHTLWWRYTALGPCESSALNRICLLCIAKLGEISHAQTCYLHVSRLPPIRWWGL